MPPFLLFSVGGLSPCFVLGLSHDSPVVSRCRRVVPDGRRLTAATLLLVPGLAGSDFGLEIFARGEDLEGLLSSAVVAGGALLLDVLVPVRRAGLVGQRADAADVAVRTVFDVDDLGLVEVVGHLVAVLPGHHGDRFASEDVGQTIVPVTDVAVGRGVLGTVDVAEVLVALGDDRGRPVERRVLVAVDRFPGLTFVDAQPPDQETVAAERRAHEMGLQLQPTVHLAGRPVDGQVLEAQRAALRGCRRVGAATRSRAGDGRAGGGGKDEGRGLRNGGSRHAAREFAAAVRGVELRLVFAAADADEGGAEDEGDADAEGLDVHEFRAPGVLGLLSSSSPEGASRLVLTSVPPLARRT